MALYKNITHTITLRIWATDLIKYCHCLEAGGGTLYAHHMAQLLNPWCVLTPTTPVVLPCQTASSNCCKRLHLSANKLRLGVTPKEHMTHVVEVVITSTDALLTINCRNSADDQWTQVALCHELTLGRSLYNVFVSQLSTVCDSRTLSVFHSPALLLACLTF